tara:strand:- start:4998 stop:6212 length:1215 start_codon:yes stop_codon:yes gene_type:complete
MRSEALSSKILKAFHSMGIKSTIERPIVIHEPDFKNTNATEYVEDCIKTGWVSSAGKWVRSFEEKICSYTGSKYCVAVNNGTAALRLALHIIGVRSNDEVFIPPISFVATANAVSHLGAVPHFVDVENETLGLSADSLSKRIEEIGEIKNGLLYNKLTGRKISAVIVVHVFGNPANIFSLLEVTRKWNIALVEDAAEALGSWVNDNKSKTHCGLIGDIGIISFNGNKLITTGGGGAIITNNKEFAENSRHLSTTAKKIHPWDFYHDQIAWNDRLPNLNAALGVAQLENINNRLLKKKILFNKYLNALSNIDEIELIKERINTKSNNWLITIRFKSNNYEVAKNNSLTLLSKAHEIGLLLRPIWRPLNLLPMYQKSSAGKLSNSENQYQRFVSLPSSPQLLDDIN